MREKRKVMKIPVHNKTNCFCNIGLMNDKGLLNIWSSDYELPKQGLVFFKCISLHKKYIVNQSSLIPIHMGRNNRTL